MRFSRMRAIPLALTVLTLLATGCAGSNNSHPIEIKTLKLEPHTLQAPLEVVGVLVPGSSVDLSSRIAGQVRKLPIDVGSPVNAGDLLVELETDLLDAQMLTARAALQSAEAAAELASNQATLAKIDLEAGQRNYDEVKALFSKEAVSRTQLDEATDRLNQAKRRSLSASGPALAQARAAINTARASIRNLEVQIGNATIRSPLNGVVTNVTVRPGVQVNPGTLLVSVVNTSLLKFKSTVPQEMLPLLKVGQKARVTVDIYPGKVIEGTVTTLGPIAVSTGEVFPIEVSFPNLEGLLPGVSARAAFQLSGHEGLFAPSAAVRDGGGEHFVYVVDGGVASRRPVTTGLRTGDGVEILHGLSGGDLVAVTNVDALHEGMAVSAP